MTTKPIVLPLLRDLPKEVKLLALLVMLGLGVGYAHAIGYVYLTTHIVPKGVAERYRGSEISSQPKPPSQTDQNMGIGSAEDVPSTATSAGHSTTSEPTSSTDIQYEKSLAEMLNMIHTHIITMTLIFAVSGFLTVLTGSLPNRLRKFAIVEPFIGILATFGGIWATRYLGAGWSWLVSLSGAVMALAFALQFFAVVLELRTKPTLA